MMTKLMAVGLGLALLVSPKWRTQEVPLDNLTVLRQEINRDHPRASRLETNRRKVILWATEKYVNRKQAEAFVEIVWRESRFNQFAVNESSGAYGLAQANPPTKYELIADDWRTNMYTQLRWMHRYILERYETPKNALQHHDRKGWY